MNEQELKAALKIRRQSLIDALTRLDVAVQAAIDCLKEIDESKHTPEELWMSFSCWYPTFLSNLNLCKLINKIIDFQNVLATLITLSNINKERNS